jgi:hypothetical protein
VPTTYKPTHLQNPGILKIEVLSSMQHMLRQPPSPQPFRSLRSTIITWRPPLTCAVQALILKHGTEAEQKSGHSTFEAQSPYGLLYLTSDTPPRTESPSKSDTAQPTYLSNSSCGRLLIRIVCADEPGLVLQSHLEILHRSSQPVQFLFKHGMLQTTRKIIKA